MSDHDFGEKADRGSTLHHLRRGLQALCLGTMVAGFASIGALGYMGWKLFHNPYRTPERRAHAPSLEAAEWAAEVYRLEKRDHLLFTGILEVGLVAVSAGSWFGYRRVDRHLQALDRARRSQTERTRPVGANG